MHLRQVELLTKTLSDSTGAVSGALKASQASDQDAPRPDMHFRAARLPTRTLSDSTGAVPGALETGQASDQDALRLHRGSVWCT